MSKRRNTRNYGATETQVVRSIDRKRAVLKVIGRRAMKCAHCDGGHVLVSQGGALYVLDPCSEMQGPRS